MWMFKRTPKSPAPARQHMPGPRLMPGTKVGLIVPHIKHPGPFWIERNYAGNTSGYVISNRREERFIVETSEVESL